MAGYASPLPYSFHSDQLVLAEPGRALVRAYDRETTAPRGAQVRQAAREGHPGLGGQMERRPQAIHLDEIRGRNTRIARTTSAADQRSRTLGPRLLCDTAVRSGLTRPAASCGRDGVGTARVSQIEHGQVARAAIRGLAGYVEALGGELELVANFGEQRPIIG